MNTGKENYACSAGSIYWNWAHDYVNVHYFNVTNINNDRRKLR